MKWTCVVLVAVAMVGTAGVAAASPPACSARTIAGTYAAIIYGNLFVGTQDLRTLDPASVPDPAMAPPLMPGAQLGLLTFEPDGTVHGKVWPGFGAMWWPGLPLTGTVTVNPDCTAELVYPPVIGGDGFNAETLVIFDNGREIRGISKQVVVAPPLAFISEYHRVEGREAGGSPGVTPRTAGSWVMTCTGFTPVQTPGGMIGLSAAMLAHFEVNPAGSLTGRAVHKVGPHYVDQAITGTLTGNADGTLDGLLDMRPDLPFVYSAKGLLYDEGRRGAIMPMFGNTETPAGPVQVPMPARVCRLERR
jgi:hypothetical protein